MQAKLLGFCKGAMLVSAAKQKANEYKAEHQKLYRQKARIKELVIENTTKEELYQYYMRTKLEVEAK